MDSQVEGGSNAAMGCPARSDKASSGEAGSGLGRAERAPPREGAAAEERHPRSAGQPASGSMPSKSPVGGSLDGAKQESVSLGSGSGRRSSGEVGGLPARGTAAYQPPTQPQPKPLGPPLQAGARSGLGFARKRAASAPEAVAAALAPHQPLSGGMLGRASGVSPGRAQSTTGGPPLRTKSGGQPPAGATRPPPPPQRRGSRQLHSALLQPREQLSAPAGNALMEPVPDVYGLFLA